MKRIALILALVSIHLLFSYNYFPGWWYASLGTAFIFLLAYFIWGREVWVRMGARIRWMELLYSLALTIVLIIGSFLLMRHIGVQQDVAIQATAFKNYYHIFFYTLNEEIILGAILLFSLQRRFINHELSISIGVALGFSLIHFVFYIWVFLERDALSMVTLIVLTLVGILRNNLILKYRHIGYSLALHFSWMAVMFGSHHYYFSTGARLTEPERFNLYLGSPEMLIISMILAVLSMVLLKRHKIPIL